MEQQDSVKGELQTLIMLEQQQNQTLDAIHSKGAFNPTAAQVNGFGFGASHYAPNTGGFQRMPVVGEYMNQMSSALNYANNMPGMQQLNNAAQSVRNAAVVNNLDSANWITMNQSKLSMEARELRGATIGEKMATGTLGAASMLSGWAGQGLAGAVMPGFFGSIIGGAVGGAAVGAVVDIAADQTKQNFAYNRYLLQNSYRFINPFESNNDRNISGFNRRERWDTANWLRKFNTSMKISDDDTMTLLKGFTEGNLLRDVSDVDTFKKKMTELTKSVKTMALSLNETYEEVVQTMADLKKAGLDTRDYKVIAGLGKVTGSFTGQDAGQTVDYQTNLATALNSGTSLDVNKTMSLVQGTESFFGALYTDAEKNQDNDEKARMLYNRINNRGGIEGATSDYLQMSKELLGSNNSWFNQSGAAFYRWNGSNWVFSKEDYEAYKNQDLNTITQIATNKMFDAGTTASQLWTNNSGNIMMGTFGGNLKDMNGLFSAIVNAAKSTAGMEGWTTEQVMESLFGLSGENTKFFAGMTDAVNARPELYNQINAMAFAQTMSDEVMSNRAGLGYELKNTWGKFTDVIGDVVAPIGSGFNAFGEWFSDKWYGGVADMNKLRARWGQMDWDGSPTKGIEDALAKYAEAVKEAGYENAKGAVDLGINGGDVVGTRGVYSSIDKLADALKGLADNVTDYAQIIRDAADESNVSENVAAVAVKALGIKDAGGIENIVNQLGSYNNLSPEDALRQVLKNNGLSDNQVNKALKSLNLPEFMTDNQESYLKGANRETNQNSDTAKYFGAADGRAFSKVANLSDAARGVFGGANQDVFLANALGIDVAVKDDFLSTHTNKDMSEEDRNRVSRATLANISETISMLQDEKRWNSLTFQDAYDRLSILATGIPFLESRGVSTSSLKASLASNDRTAAISAVLNDPRASVEDIMGKYLLGTDEKRAYYAEATGNSADKVSTKQFEEFLNNGSAGMYDSETSNILAKYANLTPDEVKDAIEKDMYGVSSGEKKASIKSTLIGALTAGAVGGPGAAIQNLWTSMGINGITQLFKKKSPDEEIKKTGAALTQAGQAILDSISDPSVRNQLSEIITSDNGATAKQLRSFGVSDNLITSYVSAKEKADAAVNVKKQGQAAIEAFENYQADSEAKADAYIMLGQALNLNPSKLKAMRKSLTGFDKKSVNQIESLFENAGGILSGQMFGEYIGTTVTDENRQDIEDQLSKALQAGGMFSQDQISSLVSGFASSKYMANGKALTGDSVNKFTEYVLSSITNGDLTPSSDASLKKSMDDLKGSVDEATEAIKNTKGYKDNSDSNNNLPGPNFSPNQGNSSATAGNLTLNANGSSSSSYNGTSTGRGLTIPGVG